MTRIDQILSKEELHRLFGYIERRRIARAKLLLRRKRRTPRLRGGDHAE